jgi:hypothetical protein
MTLTCFRSAIISAAGPLGHFHLARQSTALRDMFLRGSTTWLMKMTCMEILGSFIKQAKTRSNGASVWLQEGVRNCVERVFGVRFCKFEVMFVSIELWSVE